ncbi:MAG: PAS domain-containing protein, partial [Gemmatimonadota bacterium]
MTAPESSPADGSSEALLARRYRRLFDQDLVGIYRSDPERGGVLVACNRAIADMFGYDAPEQMEGTRAGDFYRGGAEDREEAMRDLRERGELVEYDLEMERRDGSPIWVLVHSKLVDDPEDGRVVEGMMVDVTERVRTRRELAERERRFREMAETIEEVFWLR